MDSEEEQSSDIGNTAAGSGEHVHHYTNETINKYRTVTYDYGTGERTYQSDEEVIRILENVRRTSSSSLYSSSGQNVPARVRRNVFPPDERVLISSTSSFPHSAIGRFNAIGVCTLFLIGPHHAVTAAHCVYNRTSSEFEPLGYAHIGRTCAVTGTRVSVQKVTVHKAFLDDGDASFDLAYVVLSESEINSSDYFSFGYRDPIPTESMTICGYPIDQPTGCMYCSTCNDAQRLCVPIRVVWQVVGTHCYNHLIQYTCDTAGGMSGGPAYIQESTNTLRVYGVHTSGHATVNSATRLLKDKFWYLCQWMIDNGHNPNCRST